MCESGQNGKTRLDGERATRALACQRSARAYGPVLASLLCVGALACEGETTSGGELALAPAGADTDVASSCDPSTDDPQNQEHPAESEDEESEDEESEDEESEDEESEAGEESDGPDRPTVPSDVSETGCITDNIQGVVSLPRASGITIDGDASDWRGIDFEIAGSQERQETLKLAVDCDSLYVLVQGRELSKNTQLIIDADGDAATGEPFDLKDDWAASGADYMFESLTLFKHNKVPFEWTDAKTGEAMRGGETVMEYKLPVKALGKTLPGRFGLAFRNVEGSEVPGQIPASGMWRIPPIHGGRGMIVPAYIASVQDDTPWRALGSAAAAMKSAKQDFWAVITGANFGPNEITDALLSRWQALQDSGAELFAYVHTCKHEQPAPGDDAEAAHRCDHGLRDEKTVLLDAQGYVKAFDDWNGKRKGRETKLRLAGIWIDEFYPDQEVKARQSPSSEPLPSMLDASKQVKIEGGYYANLTTLIRGENARWKLIGNAGGRLETNQLHYAKLVDVACTFEASFGNIDPYDRPPPDGKGPGLAIQTVRPKYGQLALVHGTAASPTQMVALVDRVFSEGYSHVYVTDVPHKKPDGELNNLWGTVPSYLGAQVTHVSTILSR